MKKGNTEITIPEYIRFHIHDKENGHDIIIVSGETHKERIMTIRCRWPKGKNPRTKPFTHKLKDSHDLLDKMRKEGL